MRAAASELDDRTALAGENAARRFRSDHGLKHECREKIGLDQLRFNDGRPHNRDRLIGENRRAFRQSKQIAGETQLGKIFEKSGGSVLKLRERAQIVDLIRLEPEIQKIFDGLLESGGN